MDPVRRIISVFDLDYNGPRPPSPLAPQEQINSVANTILNTYKTHIYHHTHGL